MNIRLYNPPEQWTEDHIKNISDEDNRFEFKSGLILTQHQNDFEKTLAKELCALANSFGGTLFIGVQDRTKIIDGVPKIKAGRQSTKAWIEDIIPKLLEFRVPDFRVLEVLLDLNTIANIGNTQTVISIDIYDSDLAPHRSLKDQTYYYRQGSQSVPAPHHYLAFLWGRTSPNMSNVIQLWFKRYLNSLIEILWQTREEFGARNFNSVDSPVKPYLQVLVRDLVFFDMNGWKNLESSLTAKQFLKTFPSLENKLFQFKLSIESFFDLISALNAIIKGSTEIEMQMKEKFYEFQRSNGIDISQYENMSAQEILRLYSGRAFPENLRILNQHIPELEEIIAKMVSYNLLGLDMVLSFPYSYFYEFCKEQIVPRFDNSKKEIQTLISNIFCKMEEISICAEKLFYETEELRYSLALKYNATYE